jgi:cysteinyl-tRNA synthetase
MLRLYDQAAGRAQTIRPARRGELYTYTMGPAEGEPVQPSDLRRYLLSDLIRRVAERHRLQVTAWHNVADGPGGTQAERAGDQIIGQRAEQTLRAACDALNIYPAEFSAHAPSSPDIVIGPAGGTGDSPGSHRVSPAGVLFSDNPADVGVADLVARGFDPLALRLAFLQGHYRQPITIGWDAIAGADESLRWWRKRAADGARSPSRPMCTQQVRQITAAFDDDLETPAALGTLRAIAEDGAIPPGARFETFAYLDRLLGLDLASEVGR